MTYLRLTILALWCALLIGGCSDSSDSLDPESAQAQRFLDFESYQWRQVASGNRWEPRAGLQVLALDRRLYLMGRRAPRPPMTFPPIPGDSDIWSEVTGKPLISQIL